MPRPKTHTQTVLFNKAIWHDRVSVRNWLRRHDLEQEGIDETKNFYRARQLPPGKFVRGSLRTITLSKADGLESVVGHLKEGNMATSKKKTSKKATTKPAARKTAKKAGKKAAKKKTKAKPKGPVDPSRKKRPGETFAEHMARLRGMKGEVSKLKKLAKRHTKAEDALRAEEEKVIYERGRKALLAAGVTESQIPPAKKSRKKVAKKVTKKAAKTSRAKARHALVQRAAKRAMAAAKKAAKMAAAKARAVAKKAAAKAKAAAKKAAAKAKAQAAKARKQAARVTKTHTARVRRSQGKKA